VAIYIIKVYEKNSSYFHTIIVQDCMVEYSKKIAFFLVELQMTIFERFLEYNDGTLEV